MESPEQAVVSPVVVQALQSRLCPGGPGGRQQVGARQLSVSEKRKELGGQSR
jgi:hypothetical protein